MTVKVRSFWGKYNQLFAVLLAISSGVFYVTQSWQLIHSLPSTNLDEGMYVVKGYFFATGKYIPYEDYGPMTNHMPLSFLIPGYVQLLFGPGIRTARYYAIILGFLFLLGLWFATNRLGGRWWAVVAITAYTLNPAWIESFSQVFSQGLVNFFLVWMIVFIVGEKRKIWELTLGGCLAGLIGMTRINMMPILFLLVIYIFWHYGKKAGVITALAGIFVIVVIHAIFWPEILKFWANWVPEGVLSFIDPYRSPWRKVRPKFIVFPLVDWLGNTAHSNWKALKTFWSGLRINFLPAIGLFASLLLWPSKKEWKSKYQFKISVFFTVSFLFLMALHLWGAWGGSSCRFTCFIGYMMFINVLGLMLIVSIAASWRRQLPVLRQIVIGIFTTLYVLGLEYGFGFKLLSTMLYWKLYKFIYTPVPRFKNLQIEPGTVPLWGLLENKFGWSYKSLHDAIKYAASLTHWIYPLIFVVIVVPIFSWLLKRFFSQKFSFGWVVLVLTIITGFLLSPTRFIGRWSSLKCDSNVIETYEVVGEEISGIIPPGSQLYWDVKSPFLILYLSEPEIFPPQINSFVYFVRNVKTSDSGLYYKFGLWNDELREQWIEEADYILVEGRFFETRWQNMVELGELEILAITSQVEECRGDDSRVFILQKETGRTGIND
jgi:hypothetical protein